MKLERSHSVEIAPPQPEVETLTLSRARKLFFLSFEHSQGNTALQKLIFDYLHHLHPDWTIDEPLKADLTSIVTQPIIRYALPQPGKALWHSTDAEVAALDQGGMLNEIKEQMHTMQHSFNRTPGDPPQMLNMAATIINRDLSYLGRGRPRSPQPSGKRLSPKADPYFSYFVYYGLDGHSTGVAEYDRMYGDVVAAVVDTLPQKYRPTPLCDNIYTELHSVIVGYYQKHPSEVLSVSTENLRDTLLNLMNGSA